MSTKKVSQQTLKEIKQFVREKEIEEWIEDLNVSDESDDSDDEQLEPLLKAKINYLQKELESKDKLIKELLEKQTTTFIYEYCEHCKPKE